MSELTLIQCVNSKLDYAAPAKSLYDSTYFKLMRQYAEHQSTPWRILSAKHGLVHPNTVLEPYDEKGLSSLQGKQIAASIDDDKFDTVRIIAGKQYTNPLVPALERRGIDVIEIAQGLRIGERMSRLKELID